MHHSCREDSIIRNRPGWGRSRSQSTRDLANNFLSNWGGHRFAPNHHKPQASGLDHVKRSTVSRSRNGTWVETIIPILFRSAASLAFLASLSVPGAAAGCGYFDNPCETPAHLDKIETITIEQNWKIDEDDIITRCSERSPLTVGDVRAYLEKAGRISDEAAKKSITLSSCRAHGTLTTSTGRKGTWNIGLFREGILTWPDNSSKKDYLYCGHCKAPFAE